MRRKKLSLFLSLLITLCLAAGLYSPAYADEAEIPEEVTSVQEQEVPAETEEDPQDEPQDSPADDSEPEEVPSDSTADELPAEEEPSNPPQQTEEPVSANKTYTAETSELKVEATVPAQAFEGEVILEAEKLAEESEAYKQAEACLREDIDQGKKIAAFDIRFMQDGHEVEPTLPVDLKVQINKTALDSSLEAGTVTIKHLDESAGTLQPETLASTEQVSDTGSTLEASFTTENFSTFAAVYQTAEQSDTQQTDTSIPAAESPVQTLADAPATQATYPYNYTMYCYAALPSYTSLDNIGTENPNNYWNGVFTLSIASTTSINTLAQTTKTYDVGDSRFSYTLPTDASQYDDLVYNGKTYKYSNADPAPDDQYTYKIAWKRIVIDSGANGGNNGKFDGNKASGNTFHLDGVYILSSPKQVTVEFSIMHPGESGYRQLRSYNVDKGETLQTCIDLVNTVVPTYEGYTFDGWYTDETLTTHSDGTTVIESAQSHYGRYIPTTSSTLSVTKNVVNGNQDDRDRLYTFKMTLQKNGSSYLSPLDYRDSEDSVNLKKLSVPGNQSYYEFSLKDGQTFNFTVPSGTRFTIEEDTSTWSSNFTVGVIVDNNPEVISPLINGDTSNVTSVTFNNYKTIVPSTGIDESWKNSAYFAATAGIACIAFFFKRKNTTEI